MEKKKKPIYKRKWFIALVAFFILGAIADGLKTNNPDKTKPTEAPTEVTEATEAEPQNLQEKLDKIGKEVFGDNYVKTMYNWDEANAVFKEDGNYDEDKTPIDFINVTVKLPDGFTDKSMVDTFHMYSTEYLEKIKDLNYRAIFLGAEAVLQDKYGKEKTEYVVKMELDKSEIDKIEFKNFNYKNLPSIAREYWTSRVLELDK